MRSLIFNARTWEMGPGLTIGPLGPTLLTKIPRGRRMNPIRGRESCGKLPLV